MKDITENIASYLIDKAGLTLGGSAQWAMYLNHEPTEPDDVITVYNSGGPPRGSYYDKPLQITDYSDFQVRVRAKKLVDADSKIEEVCRYLDNPQQFWVDPAGNISDTQPASGSGDWTHVLSLKPMSPNINLPQDENKRWIYVRNFTVIREDRTY